MERVDENYELKMAAFEVDCNDGKGEPMACHQAGEFYSVVKDQHDRAAKVYEKNCYGKNYGPSCFNLGRLFLAGKGVPQSDASAESHFAMACKEKHLQACYHQAFMLYAAAANIPLLPGKDSNSPAPALPPSSGNSKDNEKKRQEALKLFEWACTEGEQESCYFYGGHYISQKTPDRDPAKAIPYLKRACALNHAPSCFNLAVLYKNGDINVPADQAQFKEFKAITERLVAQYGGVSGTKGG